MSVALQVALALGSVAVLLGLMMAVRHVARHVGLSAEVQRKLVHVGTGVYALCLPWLFPERWPVYMLLGGTLIAMLLLRIPRISGNLGATLHGVERRSYGDFLLALAVGLCFFFSEGNLLLYVLPIAVLTVADAAAALAGTAYGTLRFKVEDGYKSVEGSVVFFIVTLLIAVVCLMLLSDLQPANILALAVMLAAFGTLVEAQSWRGFDNLFLPLGLFVFLSVHTKSDLLELAGLAVLFLVAILGFLIVGRRLGLTKHAARVYVVAMFLILAVTDVQNAILPALVLLTHAWAGLQNPCEDDYGDLDIVAALALVSFGWLAVGEATGWNAVSFYGLTAMGMAMGLTSIALHGRAVAVRWIGISFYALRAVLMMTNPTEKTWAEPMWELALICLMIPAFATMLAPDLFGRDRVFKLTVMALIPPVGYYVWAIADPAGLWSGTGIDS